jgi:hypothetical protein
MNPREKVSYSLQAARLGMKVIWIRKICPTVRGLSTIGILICIIRANL